MKDLGVLSYGSTVTKYSPAYLLAFICGCNFCGHLLETAYAYGNREVFINGTWESWPVPFPTQSRGVTSTGSESPWLCLRLGNLQGWRIQSLFGLCSSAVLVAAFSWMPAFTIHMGCTVSALLCCLINDTIWMVSPVSGGISWVFHGPLKDEYLGIA